MYREYEQKAAEARGQLKKKECWQKKQETSPMKYF